MVFPFSWPQLFGTTHLQPPLHVAFDCVLWPGAHVPVAESQAYVAKHCAAPPGAYWPAGQGWQNAEGLLMQVVAEDSPAAHAVSRQAESEPIDHCPAPQHAQSAVGSVAPAGAALPAPQVVGAHWVAPVVAAYWPAGHSAHVAAPDQ